MLKVFKILPALVVVIVIVVEGVVIVGKGVVVVNVVSEEGSIALKKILMERIVRLNFKLVSKK